MTPFADLWNAALGCQQCGQNLSTDPEGVHATTHRLCWTCYRRQSNGTAPSSPPTHPTHTDPTDDPIVGALWAIERRLAEVVDRLEYLR